MVKLVSSEPMEHSRDNIIKVHLMHQVKAHNFFHQRADEFLLYHVFSKEEFIAALYLLLIVYFSNFLKCQTQLSRSPHWLMGSSKITWISSSNRKRRIFATSHWREGVMKPETQKLSWRGRGEKTLKVEGRGIQRSLNTLIDSPRAYSFTDSQLEELSTHKKLRQKQDEPLLTSTQRGPSQGNICS